MHKWLRLSLVVWLLAVSLVVARSSFAQTGSGQAPHVMVNAAELKWGPGPPALPPGGQIAVIDGDPSKAGAPFVMAAKIPDGYKVPPHWHPTDEHIIVVSGALMLGMGDKWDQANMKAVTPGGFAKMPANMRHSALAKGETIFHVYGIGPFELTYVNASDDPRKKTSSQ
jgi:quercetin dioxygenase-like cupin family protein